LPSAIHGENAIIPVLSFPSSLAVVLPLRRADEF